MNYMPENVQRICLREGGGNQNEQHSLKVQLLRPFLVPPCLALRDYTCSGAHQRHHLTASSNHRLPHGRLVHIELVEIMQVHIQV